MRLSFLSLASGSGGNYYCLRVSEFGMLTDTGIGIRTIEKVLKDRSIDFTRIITMLITHDHTGHIKAVGYLGEKLYIPVYAAADVYRGIDKSRYVKETLRVSRKVIEKEVPLLIRDFRITAFGVLRDSIDNMRYHIECDDHESTFTTDVGHITDAVGKYICMVNHLILEASYDGEMLRFGTYPALLRERVMNPTGHLSNRKVTKFLATYYNIDLKNIWLCHLSRDSNHPELAYEIVGIRLSQEGIRVRKDVSLVALKRTTPSDTYRFD